MKKFSPIFFACLTAASFLIPKSSEARKDDNDNKREVSFKVGFGVKGGLNSANITMDKDGNVNDKRGILSYNIGVYADVALLPVLSIQPGIFLGGKGSKFTVGDEGSNNFTRVKTLPTYVEVPINVVVKLPLMNKVKLFFGAGPYAAVGVGGKNTIDGKLLGSAFSDNTNITFSNDNVNSTGSSYKGDLKRFDAGLNILGGIEISHFTLDANYGYGLVNIKPGATNGSDYKFQNRVLTIQVGLLF